MSALRPLSPFSGSYLAPEIRHLFSELFRKNTRQLVTCPTEQKHYYLFPLGEWGIKWRAWSCRSMTFCSTRTTHESAA
jgi:hypothetical protein